ncbi:MAG TPA: hypothetical protein VGR73_03225 [Bryobacteraceae bacterium]|nr:hypothetical protein [Bryobacteraceae bacterium]
MRPENVFHENAGNVGTPGLDAISNLAEDEPPAQSDLNFGAWLDRPLDPQLQPSLRYIHNLSW